VLVLRRDAVALRGAARGAGVTVGHAYSDADPHPDADAVHLVLEPAAGAATRFVVVLRVRLGLVVRVFVRSSG
jgi:hypothetical protein